jgi:hypothetical protein
VTILTRDPSVHCGKTVKEIIVDGVSNPSDLTVFDEITIIFTDGSKIKLRTDWRGSECYISERNE